MRMSADLRDLFLYEAFLYYNPLLLVVSFVSFVEHVWLITYRRRRSIFRLFQALCIGHVCFGFFYVIQACNRCSYMCIFLHISQFIFGLLLQTMMVWLWGINLWVFAQSSVNYAKIFDLDNNHLTHREIWKVFIFNGIMVDGFYVVLHSYFISFSVI